MRYPEKLLIPAGVLIFAMFFAMHQTNANPLASLISICVFGLPAAYLLMIVHFRGVFAREAEMLPETPGIWELRAYMKKPGLTLLHPFKTGRTIHRMIEREKNEALAMEAERKRDQRFIDDTFRDFDNFRDECMVHGILELFETRYAEVDAYAMRIQDPNLAVSSMVRLQAADKMAMLLREFRAMFGVLIRLQNEFCLAYYWKTSDLPEFISMIMHVAEAIKTGKKFEEVMEESRAAWRFSHDRNLRGQIQQNQQEKIRKEKDQLQKHAPLNISRT